MSSSSMEGLSLVERVRSRICEATHGRIRDLVVEEVGGRVEVRGQSGSQHLRQVALQAALELLSGDRFSAKITVG
jgi:hypothetical protein